MKLNQELKALAFDAYGTLFDVHSVISICNQLFPEHGSALSQIWRAKQLEYTWLYSLMNRYEDFWKVTESALVFACKALNLSCEPATRVKLMDVYLHLEPYPEVQQALRSLADYGYSLAILSNGSPKMLQDAIENSRLEGLFDQVISADEVEIYKPSPQVYQLAVQKMGLDRSLIGFVSSNSFDINGAKCFGFWSCWVNRANQALDKLGFEPDATVNKLTEAVDFLKR